MMGHAKRDDCQDIGVKLQLQFIYSSDMVSVTCANMATTILEHRLNNSMLLFWLTTCYLCRHPINVTSFFFDNA